jgi:hypothetical protein
MFPNVCQKLGSRINGEPMSANKNIILCTENKIPPWHVTRMDLRGNKNCIMRSVMNFAAQQYDNERNKGRNTNGNRS